MSYILDALNKSEEEKKQHKTPGLNTIHQTTEGRNTSRQPILSIALFFLFINLLGLLVWWLFFNSAPTDKGVHLGSNPPLKQRDAIGGRDHSSEIGSAAQRDERGKPEAPLLSEGQFNEAFAQRPQRSGSGANTLPRIIAQEIAAIRFSSHIYAEDPALRQVVMNGQALKEGHRFGTELELDQVTEEGVVLSYQNQSIYISVLSQWADD